MRTSPNCRSSASRKHPGLRQIKFEVYGNEMRLPPNTLIDHVRKREADKRNTKLGHMLVPPTHKNGSPTPCSSEAFNAPMIQAKTSPLE